MCPNIVLPTMSGHAPKELPDNVLGITSQTRMRASATSWTVCGLTWWLLIHRCIMSHRCSIGFRSEQLEGQSMTSVPSSSRNCLNTLATWGQAMSCTRKNSGDQLQQLKVRVCWLQQGGLCLPRPSPTHDRTGHAGWCYSVTCAQCKPALICKDNGAQTVDLSILVFSCEHQSGCMVLDCEHRSH